MGNIHVLSDEVARHIAAGEVVDRPYSILRELLDNAIDADSHNVQVEITKGGIEMIRVRDDGHGMDDIDLGVCILRHATSKINDHNDLFRVKTLGFRGEALASIGSCSVLSLTSKQAPNPTAFRAEVRFGRFKGVQPIAGTPGTIVEVTSLFHELPARRHFLKATRSETAQCRRTFIEKALPYPSVEFELYTDGRPGLKLLETNQAGRVASAFGIKLEDLKAVKGEFQGIHVNAIIARPEKARRDRSGIHIYINRRKVTDFSLIQAVDYGYGEVLPGGLHPTASIFIEIDPSLVDFNVHPAKKEVRLRRPGHIHRAISTLIQKEFQILETRSLGKSFYEGNSAATNLPGFLQLMPKEVVSQNTSVDQASSDQKSQSPYKVSLDANRSPDAWNAVAPNSSARVKYLGQAFNLFLVAEVLDRIYFVDQHAAHERVLYEQLRSGEVERQRILVGYSFFLSPEEEFELQAFLPELTRCGFCLENGGDGEYTLTEIPSSASKLPIENLSRFVRLLAGTKEDFERDVYSGLACRMAIKEGEAIDASSAQELLERSFRIDPQRCPHGRPLWFEISRPLLERSVGRQYR